MRHLIWTIAAWIIAGAEVCQAGDCLISGPVSKLDSQPIEWKLVIASGDRCLRGLRYAAMTLDSVRIAAPAKFGEASTQGYGFAYQAPRQFKGDDAFVVAVTGTNHGVRGETVIHVSVSVR